ncbi:SACE_7040 family transcriptional regulator [Streptomyces fuscigenes]|uniref:SACE_7040 family transcriptional regulator n=1 Tax=Streptomyces fuscigenes TaxID=1528880 RepID=UPI001F2A5B89|nr:TetR/AcrR family transcriptional regulator [Streptomyces fuscigenes]MCF3961326.1 TetR/AcrR family transcriptional regulator [Streptomyces fuscigenes]
MTTRTAAPTRREQILKHAARLFAERGFHGVGVDEIGAAVGISGPGLYRHFAGKDAMLAELLVGISDRLLDGGRRRVAGAAAEGPAGVLASLIDGHIDFALDDRPLITLHDRELDRLRDSDRRMVRQLQRQYVELWVGVVRDLYGRVPEEEARAAVHAVFGLLNSTPHFGSHRGGLPDREATAELLRRLAHGAFAALAPGFARPAAAGGAAGDGPGRSGGPAAGAPALEDGPGTAARDAGAA